MDEKSDDDLSVMLGGSFEPPIFFSVLVALRLMGDHRPAHTRAREKLAFFFGRFSCICRKTYITLRAKAGQVYRRTD